MTMEEQRQMLERAHARYKRIREIDQEIAAGNRENQEELWKLWQETYLHLQLSDVCPTCGRPR